MYRVAFQLTYIDNFLIIDVKSSRELLGQEEYDGIYKDLSSSKAKQSELDSAASMELFDPGLQLQRKRNKAEKPARMDITAFMGGSILLRILTKKMEQKMLLMLKSNREALQCQSGSNILGTLLPNCQTQETPSR